MLTVDRFRGTRRVDEEYVVETGIPQDRPIPNDYPPTSTASERTSIFHHVDLEWPEGIARIPDRRSTNSGRKILFRPLPGTDVFVIERKGIRQRNTRCPRRRGPFPFERAKVYEVKPERGYYPKASRRA